MEVNELIGKTFTKVHVPGDALVFEASDGSEYTLVGMDDCCNSPAAVEDVCGDLSDLIGSPLLQAEESTNEEAPKEPPEGTQESYTWSFYKFGTVKGRVTVRFLGSSNGYYSESAYLEQTRKPTVPAEAREPR